MRWLVELVVLPKSGVSDPQGEAVRQGLQMLGHNAVERVRVGKHMQVTVEAESDTAACSMVEQMAEQLLANPVIETFHVARVSEREAAS